MLIYIDKINYHKINENEHNYCFTRVFFIPAPCFLMCMMFYVFLI